MGEFEFALMFYHKGQKLRPQIEEFRLGIQKATKAIEDTIGNMYSSVKTFLSCVKIHISYIHISCPANFPGPPSVKLEMKGDLSFLRNDDEVGLRYILHRLPKKIVSNNLHCQSQSCSPPRCGAGGRPDGYPRAADEERTTEA